MVNNEQVLYFLNFLKFNFAVLTDYKDYENEKKKDAGTSYSKDQILSFIKPVVQKITNSIIKQYARGGAQSKI